MKLTLITPKLNEIWQEMLARDVANTSLEQLAVSPLKTHSLSKQRKISEAKSKLGRACSSIEERVAAAIDVERDQLKRKDPRAISIQAIQSRYKQKRPTWIP